MTVVTVHEGEMSSAPRQMCLSLFDVSYELCKVFSALTLAFSRVR